jgi:pSer/pThr/pTyr-binding forkhead associated (FHA) protein
LEEAYVEVRRDAGPERVGLSGDQLTVGRSTANDVSFPSDDTMSTLHAVLERSPDGWCVRDLGSTNGTFVNGETLAQQRTLQPGDEIVFGHSAIVFRVPAPDTPLAGPASYLDATEEWSGGAVEAPIVPRPPPRQAAPPSPAPVAPVPVSDPAGAPRKQGRGQVRGVARNVQTRRTQDEQEILTLRVDRYDESGTRLTPVAVEYRGYTGGQISDGEEVEAHGRWSSGTLRADKILNLSTSSEIRGVPKGLRVVHGFLIMLVVGFILFIALSVLLGAL